jgi:hypothetical protein
VEKFGTVNNLVLKTNNSNFLLSAEKGVEKFFVLCNEKYASFYSA